MMLIRKRVFGMSQAEFARALDVSQSTVSRWETGALEPSRQEMAAVRDLASSRGVTWSDRWFFDEAPPEKKEDAEEPSKSHPSPSQPAAACRLNPDVIRSARR